MVVSVEDQLENDKKAILGEPTRVGPPPSPHTGPEPVGIQQTASGGLDVRNEFEKGVDQFAENIGAIGAGLGATAAGISGNEEEARRLSRVSARGFVRGGELGPEITSVAQVENPSDAFKYVQGLFGSQVPQFGVTLGAAALGGIAAGPVGAAAGGFVAGSALETGADAADIILDEEAEGTVQERAAIVAVSGMIRGSLETFPAMRILKKFKGMRGVNVEKEVMKRLPRRMVEQFFKQGATEATTEAAQEAISIATHRFVNDNIELFTDENLLRLADSAIGGFLVGGAAGSILGTTAPKGLKKETKKLQQRLDAHLSGEKSLETQIKEEAEGKNSMADISQETKDRNRDAPDLEQDFTDNLKEERVASTKGVFSKGAEALKRAAKKKGIKVDELSETAKKFVNKVGKFETKVATVTASKLEGLRTSDPNSLKGKAFNFASAKVAQWYEFAQNYPTVARAGSVAMFAAGFASDAPAAQSGRSKLDGMMTEIHALGVRREEKALSDRQRATIDARANKLIQEILADPELAAEVGEAAQAQQGGVHQVTPEMTEYITSKVAQGTPVEILASKLNLPVETVAAAVPPEERFLINSRKGFTREQLSEFDNEISNDLQDVGTDEFKIATMQNAFDQLTQEQIEAVVGASEEDVQLGAEARALESAATLFGFSIEEAQTQPIPVFRGDGRITVTKHRKATSRPNEPTSAEKAVNKYNLQDGPKANRKRSLQSFADYVQGVLAKPPADRSAEELLLFGNAKRLDEEIRIRVTKTVGGKVQQVVEKTSVTGHIRTNLNLPAGTPFSGLEVMLEEVLNPEIISGVPYLLSQKQTEESFAQFGKDVTGIPIHPHSTVKVNNREINIPRLVERARTSLLSKSPSFFADVLKTGEGKPVTRLEQSILSLHHGISDLITRGIIDQWPRLQPATVIDFMRIKGKEVPITWEMVHKSGHNVRIAAMAKGMERYLLRQAEGTILRHTATVRNEEGRFGKEAVAASQAWFRKFKINEKDVEISKSGQRVSNLHDFQALIQEQTMLGMRDEYLSTINEKTMTKSEIEDGMLEYYREAAENKKKAALDNLRKQWKVAKDAKQKKQIERQAARIERTFGNDDSLAVIGQKFAAQAAANAEGITKEFNAQRVRTHARKLVNMADRTHTERVSDFLTLSKLIIEKDEMSFDLSDPQQRDMFNALIDQIKIATGMHEKSTTSEVLIAARAQINEYYYNHLSDNDRTDLDEVIGNLNITEVNRLEEGFDIKPGLPRFSARLEVQADIDAGFLTNIEDTFAAVPTLHAPVEFFVAHTARLESFLDTIRKKVEGRLPFDENAQLPAWVKKLWPVHMQQFSMDEAKVTQRFKEDLEAAKEVMHRVNVSSIEHAMYKLIMDKTSTATFPPRLGTWAEMKAAAPRTPKSRRLILQREKLSTENDLNQYNEAELFLVHHTFLKVDTNASLKERLAAMRREGVPTTEAFGNYRNYIIAELSRRVPALQYPKGHTYKDVLVPADGQQTENVMAIYDKVSKRISEGIPGVTGDSGVFTDFVDVVDLKVETFGDLVKLVRSMQVQNSIKEQQVLEAYAGKYKEENSRETQYATEVQDTKIVEENTDTRQQEKKASERVAKDDIHTDGNAANAPYTTHQQYSEIFRSVRRMIENMSTASFMPFHVDVANGQTGIPGPNGSQHAGWYDPVRNIIRIATNLNAEWVMGVGAHEAMHSVFQTLLNPVELRALGRSMRHPIVSQKILKFYKKYGADDATMRKIQNAIDPDFNPHSYIEERAAYAFQAFAMSRQTGLAVPGGRGPFKLAPVPTTLFQRIIANLKHIFRYLTEQEQADSLFESIYSGELKRAHAAGNFISLRKQGEWMLPEGIVDFAHRAYVAMGHWNRAFLTPMDIALRRTKNPALIKLADLIYRSPLYTSARNNDPTFIREFSRQRIVWTDRFQKKWETMSPQRKKAVANALYARTKFEDFTNEQTRNDVQWFRRFFKGMRTYAKDRGADLGKIDEFVPIVWSPEQVAAHEAELRALIATKDQAMIQRFGGADQIIENLKTAGDVWDDMQQIGLDHREASAKPREYSFFNQDNLSMFMQPDFEMTMQGYVKQMTRHAEYQKFLGKDGSKARELLKQAEKLGATPSEIQDATKYVLAARGVLGSNMSQRMSTLTSWIVTYQHLRVLAFATFSSFVEVQGIAVRSQSVDATWAAYKTAFEQVKNLYVGGPVFGRIAEIRQRIKVLKAKPTLRPEEDAEFEALVKERQEMRTDNVRFAEDMGTLDAAVMYDELLSSNGALGMTDATVKINKAFFKVIGLESWTNMTRVMASRAAYVFIKMNVTKPRKHSARFLRELGLQPADIVFDGDGEIIHTVEALMANDVSLSQEQAEAQAEKFRRAVWQFVDESVMRPNAAQRPLNASDPHWVMLFHLKQYIFSVQTMILNRVLKEAFVHGNALPLANLASFVPVMMAADYMRSSIQYAFSDDESPFEKYDFPAMLARSARRSGILGMVEPFTGFGDNINRFGGTGFEVLMGPGPQQALELSRTLLTGSPSAWTAFKNALPANNVYRNWGVPIL